MKHYIYKITNSVNGKIYIGAHTGSEDDDYLGSGKLIQRALKKYGREVFSKEVLEYFSTAEEMFRRESEIITEEFLLRQDIYNVAPGGSGGSISSNRKSFVGPHTEATKEKISRSRTGNSVSDETKKRLSENNWAKKNPEAQRLHAKYAASKRVHWSKLAEETKQKISSALVGKTQPTLKCPHCQKVGGERAMKRWHFDKCSMVSMV